MQSCGRSFRTVQIILAFVLIFSGSVAQALDSNPLAPADTSSPRGTLRSFMIAVDDGLDVELASTLSYLASDRLYRNEFENQLLAEADTHFIRALETLDFSGLPSGFRDVLAVEQVIRLAEILSRIDLPKFESIPDHEEMKATKEQRWVIPNTRIEINLLEEAPRRGEYLFSAATVVRLGEYYDRAMALPYKPGALQRYVEAIGSYTSTTTLYDIYRNSTPGFGLMPDRWGLNAPAWLTERFSGIAVWQLLGLAIYLLLMILVVFLARLICRKAGAGPHWRWFVTAVIAVVFASLIVPLC